MGILYVLCGAPGSGKSYFAKNFLTGTYISRDEVRFEMVQPNEPYFSKEKQVYKEFVKRVNQALEKGDCIADATHLTQGSRRKLLNNINPLNIKSIEIIVMDTPLETCLKRNSLRKGRCSIPDEQIIKMHKSFQFPSKDEGFNNIQIIKGDI